MLSSNKYILQNRLTEKWKVPPVTLKPAFPFTSCVEPHCKNTDFVPKVKAVVGCEYSEISIAVARVLNIQLIPQISYASSAEMLSDKRRFPAFLRSIPSDKHQTKAMVKLVNMSAWNWIGTIAIDDIYGRSAIELFISQATPMGICVDFKEFIPPVFSDTIINNIIEIIRKEKRVKVIVAFASPSFMKKLFQAFEGEILDKIWIASDSWSTSSEVSALPNLNNVGKVIGFTFQSENPASFYEYLKNVKLNKVISNCSDSCAKGQFRKTAGGQHTCCFECLNCTENHYSDPMDMYQCLPCDHHTEWSLPGDAECSKKELEYFMLSDFFAIALLSFAAIGVTLVCVIVVIFIRYRKTPVVKASGGAICYVILLCLFCNFVCSVFFVGEPHNIICQVRQVLYGLSFACCVSCILVKSFKILLAFNFNPYVQAVLRKLYRPVAIIIGSTGIQVLICTLWLILNEPHEERVPYERTILLQCNEGSYMAFGVMLGYIALLAVVCFVCAFKIRKLPENYNEAKFITFGMLVYFISWVIFVPIYVTSTGKYVQAIQLVVILISSYGILICQFFPKCYVILFKKEHNTKDAFLKNVYEYSAKTANNIALPNGLPPDSKPTAKEDDSAFCKTKPGFLAAETSLQVRANYIQHESFRRILDNTFPRKRVASV
ncbi:UNVERIFIED_CONTAM: hypothetical protein FKN15_043032 [Acipenser sinensis]